MNHWSFAGFVPPTVYIRFPLYVLLRIRSGQLFSMPWRMEAGCFLGEQIRRRPVLTGPTPPRCPAVRRLDPTRPWYVRVLESPVVLIFFEFNVHFLRLDTTIGSCSGINLSSPKPGNTTDESGRGGARRGGGAGHGLTRPDADGVGPPRKQAGVPLAFHTIVDNLPGFSLGAIAKESLCEPMGKRNPQLTRNCQPVDKRCIRGTTAALRSWLPTKGPSPICLCKTFACEASPGMV